MFYPLHHNHSYSFEIHSRQTFCYSYPTGFFGCDEEGGGGGGGGRGGRIRTLNKYIFKIFSFHKYLVSILDDCPEYFMQNKPLTCVTNENPTSLISATKSSELGMRLCTCVQCSRINVLIESIIVKY